MKKIFALFLISFIALAGAASAHSIWVEREGRGDTRVYFGEWIHDEIEKEDEGLSKVQSMKAFAENSEVLLPVERREDHLVIRSEGIKGDVRFVEDGFAPREDKTGKEASRTIYYARVGRSDTAATADFELVPVMADSSQFRLLFRGEAVKDAKITLMSDSKWQRNFKTDENGEVTLPFPWQGNYLAQASYQEEVSGELDGKSYGSIRHVATLFFSADSAA